MPTILRTKPRRGVVESPVWTPRGYELAHPKHGAEKHHARNAIYASTLGDAARLVLAGYWLRMGGPGLRPSLISPGSLRVIP
ncbi:hypothetical protein OCOJLMKI_4215 [Methylobacterium iners]|uniref:RES domain-containing protein n=1 Tax=Methylobacterium iners TaxID=418707 RepID=A0ABQ4S5G1_9HYPH|nr:hypothetical protein OCOJLMKI_4215 [Methylobacterium iners]